MTLADLPRGARAHIRAVNAEADTALRLREMGLRRGTLVGVVGIAAAGARVVSIGAARIAVDLATARSIDVTPADVASSRGEARA